MHIHLDLSSIKNTMALSLLANYRSLQTIFNRI